MCTYADYIEQKGIEQGISQGISQGIKQGISQGIEQGITKGKFDTMISLVNDGDITLETAAKKLQMSIPAFIKKAQEYGFKLTTA